MRANSVRWRSVTWVLCAVLAAGACLLLYGFRRYDPPRPPCQCAAPVPVPVETGGRVDHWCTGCGRTVA